jgi:heme exporter protein A
MLGGVMKPTAGQVRVAGAPANVEGRDWRHRVGFVSHQSLLYGQLTAEENLAFYGRLIGLTDLKTRISERLASLGLSDRARTPVRDLSRGLKQRVALARALLHDPEVLLLDEPYTGLDPHASAVLREQLTSLKDGRRTVVLVTHNLIQGLELSDRVAIQVQGRFASVSDSADLDLAGFEALYHSTVEGPA